MKPQTKPLTVRLRLPIHTEIEKKAEELGLDKSDVARQYILEGLNFSERLGVLERNFHLVAERLLEQAQEFERLQEHNKQIERWIDASTAVFIAYADGTSPEEGAAQWKTQKQK